MYIPTLIQANSLVSDLASLDTRIHLIAALFDPQVRTRSHHIIAGQHTLAQGGGRVDQHVSLPSWTHLPLNNAAEALELVQSLTELVMLSGVG